MDKFVFAELISYITTLKGGGSHIGEYNCREIEALISRCAFQKDAENVNNLLLQMQQGASKIEAIKAYRSLTNQGLKESKDAVERYWQPRETTAAA